MREFCIASTKLIPHVRVMFDRILSHTVHNLALLDLSARFRPMPLWTGRRNVIFPGSGRAELHF